MVIFLKKTYGEGRSSRKGSCDGQAKNNNLCFDNCRHVNVVFFFVYDQCDQKKIAKFI